MLLRVINRRFSIIITLIIFIVHTHSEEELKTVIQRAQS